METKVYNQEGKDVGKIELPEKIFGLPVSLDLLHQVVTSMSSNARAGTAHAKTRAEVRGGGKKPWQQKGTGRARHGSIRSPIWVGGGVAGGPTKEKNYSRKINRKMKNKALAVILSAKARDKELIFLDNLNLAGVKTKKAKELLDNLAGVGFEKLNYQKGRRALVTTLKKDKNLAKSFGNIKAATVEELRNLNPLSALTYQYIIFSQPDQAIKVLSDRLKT